MWERLRVILRKEFLQAFREPRMRVLLFVPPLVQLVVFGFAVNLDVDRAQIGWMDMDGTPVSRELHDRFVGSGRFDIVATPQNEDQVQALLDRGDAAAVVRVLPNFASDLARGRSAQVQVLVDGSNSNTASIVANYAGGVIAEFSADRLALQQGALMMQRGAKTPVSPAVPDIQAATRVWFNPDLYSRNYFVPGVIANIIMLVTLTLTSLAIVREKEIGTMEQLMVTPVRSIELMLGKTLPFAVVGLVDTAMITAAAMLVFRVPLHGSFLLMLGCAALFLLTTLGAGLFISTISHTQQQAMMSSFFFSMPAFMLSGFAFPIRNMPVAVQWLTYLNPIRYFMEIVRGVFLKGSGVSVLWPQMTVLAVFGIAVVGLSALRFHKKLD